MKVRKTETAEAVTVVPTMSSTVNEQTLLKALISCGAGSRRKAAAAIRDGRVSVNGSAVTDLLHPVDPQTDSITVDHVLVRPQQQPRMLLLVNKPAGVLSVTSDDRGRATVLDLLPQRYRNMKLHPVGRLDKDSTGLLLLTNDGDLTYKLTHPRFEHEKEYYVTIRRRLSHADIHKLEQGVVLEDGITYPARIKEVRSGLPFTYSITIHEGRKRQLRRMFQSLGYSVIALKRVRMGGLYLGNLPEGKVRSLSPREEKSLLAAPPNPQKPSRHNR